MIARGYWLINLKRSEVRKFTENRANEDQFKKYVFLFIMESYWDI